MAGGDPYAGIVRAIDANTRELKELRRVTETANANFVKFVDEWSKSSTTVSPLHFYGHVAAGQVEEAGKLVRGDLRQNPDGTIDVWTGEYWMALVYTPSFRISNEHHYYGG